ncbi:hypothetical protein GOODEAATRI_025372 [Goodea atripinnis]|uniref:Uncharacterized protein n=1 Tax=Goodea atripinnis TaxID=208336 RepID=A0ABV0NGS9_9TELE
MNPLPTAHGHTPISELHPRKANEATPTQRKLHTQPRSKHLRHVPPPPHSAPRRQGKGPAQRYPSSCPQAQQGRHHRAHNGTSNPTPRWDKLMRQEVPGQQQALEANVLHHATATTQTHHCNDSPGEG